MMTKKQKHVLDFVKEYQVKHDYAPSLEEIKRKFQFASVSTAHYYIKKLQEAGQLKKEFNRPRAVSVIDKKQTIEIPIVGAIAAGQPIEAIEVPDETITITKDEISKQGKHYALRVQGSSMIEEGVFDGDVVVIREQEVADNGQTVVAIIDDNEATLKKLYRERGRFRLQPANPALFPIYRDAVEIRGVVVKI
ncbi:MAG: transcriptional repressor LexA, partial [Patescibacteria group bacterium]